MAELIVALDYNDANDAISFAKKIERKVDWVKVGLELYISEGPRIIQTLRSMKFQVFLDLKLNDIPNTVRGAVLASAMHKVDMMTLHITGGEKMIREALSCLDNVEHKPLLFGVTVLTSITQGEFPCFSGDISDLARRLADEAANWNMNGIVCSGHEVENIKKRHPKLLALCPGIRMPEGDAGDQKRVITPSEAVRRGADYLVVGRPITQAKDPVEAAQEILADMAKA